MKSAFIFLLILPATIANAQQLGDLTITEIPKDQGTMFIVRNPGEAVLIVHSTIPVLSFECNMGILKVDNPDPGEYRVNLNPGTNIVSFKAEGFLPKKVRYNIRQKDFREVRVESKQLTTSEANRPIIRLIYEPSSDEKQIFGGIDDNVMSLDFTKGFILLRPSPGKHTVKIFAEGMVWEKEYSLKSGDEVEDPVTFTKRQTEAWDIKEPGNLYITTMPQGATVYVNQVEQGISPLTLEDVLPGTYQIEVVRDLYLPDSRNVEVKSLAYSDVSFTLTANFGKVKITSTPLGAMVWIDDQQRGETPLDIPQFRAGKHLFRLVKNMYHEQSDTIEIIAGSEFTKDYSLKPQFGKVTIQTDPAGAEVIVDGKPWGRSPLTREQVFSGKHVVRMNLLNYFNEEKSVTVEDEGNHDFSFELRPSVGWLSLNTVPPGAQVTIIENERILGQTPLENIPVERGTYHLRIEKNDYELVERAIGLTLGGRQDISIDLIRKTGHLRVSSEPQGAKILLNQEYYGETPTVLKDIPTGEYEIRLEIKDYDIHLGSVAIDHQKVNSYNCDLVQVGMAEWKKRRFRAQLLSIFCPGGGQLLSKQYVQGSLYAGAFLGALDVAIVSLNDYSKYKRGYNNAMGEYYSTQDPVIIDQFRKEAKFNSDNMQESKEYAQVFFSIACGVYIWQLVDVYLWGGGDRPVSKANGISLGNDKSYCILPYTNESSTGLRLSFKLK